MEINADDLMASLNIMWKGMVLLFVCCGFITLLTMGLNWIFGKKNR